eukprot:m.259967 g.259967  ORF g.259967 m.259967 type:complete len:455 (+) comp26644_c0_seq1:209-1573(+)
MGAGHFQSTEPKRCAVLGEAALRGRRARRGAGCDERRGGDGERDKVDVGVGVAAGGVVSDVPPDGTVGVGGLPHRSLLVPHVVAGRGVDLSLLAGKRPSRRDGDALPAVPPTVKPVHPRRHGADPHLGPDVHLDPRGVGARPKPVCEACTVGGGVWGTDHQIRRPDQEVRRVGRGLAVGAQPPPIRRHLGPGEGQASKGRRHVHDESGRALRAPGRAAAGGAVGDAGPWCGDGAGPPVAGAGNALRDPRREVVLGAGGKQDGAADRDRGAAVDRGRHRYGEPGRGQARQRRQIADGNPGDAGAARAVGDPVERLDERRDLGVGRRQLRSQHRHVGPNSVCHRAQGCVGLGCRDESKVTGVDSATQGTLPRHHLGVHLGERRVDSGDDGGEGGDISGHRDGLSGCPGGLDVECAALVGLHGHRARARIDRRVTVHSANQHHQHDTPQHRPEHRLD